MPLQATALTPEEALGRLSAAIAGLPDGSFEQDKAVRGILRTLQAMPGADRALVAILLEGRGEARQRERLARFLVLKDPAVLHGLLTALPALPDGVRKQALGVAAHTFGGHWEGPGAPAWAAGTGLVEPLLRLAGQGDPAMQRAAVLGLKPWAGSRPEVFDQLRRLAAGEGDTGVRLMALEAAAGAGDPRGADLVLRMLTDVGVPPELRDRAVGLLAVRSDPRAKEPLLRLSEDPRCGEAAILALGRYADEDASILEKLDGWASAGPVSRRVAALKALRGLPAGPAAQAAKERLLTRVAQEDGDEKVRTEALRALATCGGPASLAWLGSLAKETGSPALRQEAGRALNQIRSRQP